MVNIDSLLSDHIQGVICMHIRIMTPFCLVFHRLSK